MSEEHLQCPACKKRLDRPVRFCYLCGAWWQHGVPTDAVVPAGEGRTWPCPRCTSPSPRRVNFCASCGYRLTTAPVDADEAAARTRIEREAGTTPARRDRATIRRNVCYLVAGGILLVASIVFQVRHPGTQSAYLGPIALLMLVRLPVSWTVIKRTKARQRTRRAVAEQPVSSSA